MTPSELTAQQSERGGDQGAMVGGPAALPASWVGFDRVPPALCHGVQSTPTPSIAAPSPSALLDWLCCSSPTSHREEENITHAAFGRLVTKSPH